MKIESVIVACFSPTGTSQAIAKAIADGFGGSDVDLIDVTTPEGRRTSLATSEADLLVLALPVYMGRVPALVRPWLESITARNTPTVCVVVYGNRAYENALLELRDIARNCGCIPVGCAACIGEHSFSSQEKPTAHGRPDAADLDYARQFGAAVRRKLDAVPSIDSMGEVAVPGSYPYGGVTQLWDVDFITVDDACGQCGHCAEICPAGAIDRDNPACIDTKTCITCCACIKRCPQQARGMKPGPVMDAQQRLNTLFSEPKEPECFL